MVSKDSEIIDLNEQDFKNKYNEVFELIHTTSHSILYRMRRDGKYFIVKQSTLSDEKGRKILRREYEISIGLSHPNIIDIYEYRYDENYQDSIIMEYVEGRTLNDFLAELPSSKTKKRIFSELLDAIDYLHQHRIIHNDIKPKNIIISRTGDRLKLIDLGLSDNDMHYAIKSVGFTRGFSAPELIEEGKSDVRSDIYSLGVIARILFGKKYSDLIRKCTSDKPEKRYQTIAEVKRKWTRLYWRWLTPVIILIVLIISCLISFIINDRFSQNRERMILKKELQHQSQELSSQKASFVILQNRYNSLKDSIGEIERKKKEKETKKKEVLEKFTSHLQKITNLTIDSLRSNSSYFEISPIRFNYMQKAHKLYENQNKIVDQEDISPQLYSIFITELSKVDKEFERILQNY